AWGLIGRRPSETDSTAWPGATGFEPLHSWRPQHHHCPFGSASVEVPGGCEVASNRLASITKLASMLTTETRNGNSMRVPAIGARATSISRPSERYLMSGVDARWPAIGSYRAEHTATGPAYPLSAATWSVCLNASLRS